MGTDSIETLSAKLDLLIKSVDDLREDSKQQDKEKVGTLLWEQRNIYVNERFQSLGREIGELRARLEAFKTQLENRRAPWWAIVSAIASGFAVFWTLTNGTV